MESKDCTTGAIQILHQGWNSKIAPEVEFKDCIGGGIQRFFQRRCNQKIVQEVESKNCARGGT